MNQSELYEFTQGDPYSGPAYGDKEKSKGLGMVLGVVASVATMGAAAPMLASASMASQIAGGAMMAGGVLTGVGAVTGNKKLTKIGGVLSLAGGLGNMAAGALNIGQGAGSQAVAQFGTNFMESANNLGLGEFYSAETIAAGKAAGGLTETAASGLTETAADAGQQSIQLAGESGAGGMDGQTLDLAKSELAAATPNNTRGILSNAGSSTTQSAGGIDYAKMGQLGDAPAASGGPQVLPGATKEAGPLDKALGFVRENAEITKIGAGMLEKAMGAAAGDDDKTKALIDYYKAQGALTLTQNELAQYKLANAGKQVAMISADDPDRDAKVKQATAKGIPVSFIPSVGANYTPYSKNFTPVARDATYNQPTA